MNKTTKQRKFGYNGYANYETWTIGLWDYTELLWQEALDQGESEVDAQWCEDFMYDLLEIDSFDNIVGDWVTASFGEVDFREIAEMTNEAIQENIQDYL